MAYNLYQVQLANAWAQRIDKELLQAEKFWTKRAHAAPLQGASGRPLEAFTGRHLPGEESVAGTAATSAAPTGYTSKSSYLKSRLDVLERELQKEREGRKKVEEDLATLRSSGTLKSTGSSKSATSQA